MQFHGNVLKVRCSTVLAYWTASILLFASFCLCDIAVIAWSARIVSAGELAAAGFTFALISFGIMATVLLLPAAMEAVDPDILTTRITDFHDERLQREATVFAAAASSSPGFGFEVFGVRAIAATFDGGAISDGGALFAVAD